MAFTDDQVVKMIQAELRDRGFYAGAIDGAWGNASQVAWDAAKNTMLKPATQLVVPAPVVGAKALYQGSARHLVKEIVIHCTATHTAWMHNATTAQKVAEVKLWHTRDRGWNDIGYHWLIDRDGTVVAGRAETVVPSSVQGHNSGTIAITLFGGATSTTTDAFETNYTEAQRTALLAKIADIKTRASITKISGHNQYAAKACPGFFVPAQAWLK